MKVNIIPSFREMTLQIISNKYKGEIDQRAWNDNRLSDRLIDAMNFDIDLAEVPQNMLQEMRDEKYQEEITK